MCDDVREGEQDECDDGEREWEEISDDCVKRRISINIVLEMEMICIQKYSWNSLTRAASARTIIFIMKRMTL